MASNKWVKPKTTPPKAKKISLSNLAAKQGYKEPPGVGEKMVMDGLVMELLMIDLLLFKF